VDMSQSVYVASPQFLAEAESLIRSLAGVVNARIHASGTGIESIHIEVDDAERARVIAGHVRSALLAGLATPVTPARIHVRVVGPASGEAEHSAAGHHRLRLIQDAQPHGIASPHLVHDTPTREGPDVTEKPRLVAVDLERREDGRVRCAVTITFRTAIHRADAVAVDLPGAAAQAAAQATVRALVDAGIDSLELDGLREVEIAGRDYVLVALRRAHHYTRVRSGSAPITGAPERAAALAAVEAAKALL
jgi:hypothetical protein